MTIQVVEFFQSFRNGFFDFFFSFISFLGEEYIYILILAIIYYAYNKKLGEFLAFALFTTAGINTIIKGLFSAQRPFEKYPDRVDNLRPDTATGHSFPSGHVQNFTTFLFAESFYTGKQRMFIVSGILAVLMMISRMYLGVHFLEDVTVSILLGILVAYVLHKVYTKYQDNHVILHKIYIGIAVAMFPFLFLLDGEDFFKSYGLLVGFILAMIIEKKYINFSDDTTIKQKLIRVALGLVIMLVLQTGLKPVFGLFTDEGTTLFNIFNLVRYLLISFIGLGIYPFAFKKLKL